MQLSPLQLLEYTFEGVSVLPVDGYVAETQFAPGMVFFPGKLAISADTGLVLLEEQPSYSDFGVKLTLRVRPKTEAAAPYTVEISARGMVRMHLTQEQGQAEERQARALVNGVSLLYGVVREMVSNITSRSVHGPMLLPSLSFADLSTRQPAQTATAEPAPPEKASPRKRKVAGSRT